MRFVAFSLIALLLTVAFAAPAAAQADGSPNPANTEWIETTLVISQPDRTTLDIAGTVTIRKFVIEDTSYDTADDLAQAYQDLLQADEFARQQGQESNGAEDFLADLRASMKQSFETSLAGSYPDAQLQVEEPTIDMDTLQAPEGDPYEPGVALSIDARIVRSAESSRIGDLSDEAIAVAFDAGARASTTSRFTAAAGHDVTFVLEKPTTPANIAFVQAEPASVATIEDGRLVVRVDNSAGTSATEQAVEVTVANPEARTYTDEEIARGASVVVKVDLQDVDISIGKAIGGDMGNLLGEVTIRTELSLLELPAEFKDSLPGNVEIATVSSNAIRLLAEHGAIAQADLDKLEQTFLTQVGNNLGGALGTSVAVTGGFAPGTMSAEGIESADGGAPIVLEARASFTKSLSGAPAPDAQAAIALYTTTQSFTLPRVQGLDTSYTIVLPKGLALMGVDAAGGDASAGTSDDGRDQFTVTPEGEQTQATVSMAVTPTFVTAKFWPALLLAAVVLMLVIGTPIALFVRGRKGA